HSKSFVHLFKGGRGQGGGAPCRPSAMINKVYLRNLLYPSKTEQGVRNATAFRGEANTTASPSYEFMQTNPQKRSGGTFLTEQILYKFVQIIQLSFLFQQTEPPLTMPKAAVFV
ncbi:hypothetical protein, partial [Huintestinicola sp.]|uniref:hypothetical protein n=1 Tax=Huintestinicola sp. TaxID=2981661 RepID=UPI003D7CB62A